MHGRPIAHDERELMIALAMNGKKNREIAETLRRPMGTVARVLSDAVFDGKLERRIWRDIPRRQRHYDR